MAHADIVVGLGFGDEAKGSTVDALAARTRPDRVVRFNGGQQAGHNVTVGQVHHTFASFGSATLLGVPTWVSGHCTIDPPAAHRELQALRRLGVDPQLFVTDDALVTTTWHVAANLARETARGATPHGTTGRGFGETVDYSLTHPAWAPRVGDLDDLGVLTDKLTALAKHYAHQGLLTEQPPQRSQVLADELATAAKNTLTVVSTERLLDELARGHTLFEGAQGYWLDECFGF
ncbi:MAG: adenylosuccinate synthetase, partial [Micrococcales bacterium]|nr:adenylosuccinate synthetase [Micrococcales bacterium]